MTIDTPNPRPPKPTERLLGGLDPTVPALDLDPRSLAAGLTAHQNRHNPRPPNDGAFMPARPDGDDPRPLVDLGSLDRTMSRPAWHSDGTPDEVAAAWAKLAPGADRVQELGDDADLLDAADAHDLKDYKRAVDAAVAAGEPVPKFEPVDRSADRITVEAEAAAQLRHGRNLRRQYDRLVEKHAPEWRSRLVADYGDLVPAARVAYQQFETAWKFWRSRTRTIAALNKIEDRTWRNPGHDHQKADLYKKTAEGMPAIAAILGSSNPSVNGSHVCDELHVDPPIAVRRDWNTQSEEHRRLLGEVEQAEGYTVTAFTKPDGWKPPADPAADAAPAQADDRPDDPAPAKAKAKAKPGGADAGGAR